MRILTEAEYQRRIEEARLKGYEEASNRIKKEERDNVFREDVWRAVRESRNDFDRQIRELVITLKKVGIPDPFEPKAVCGCGDCVPTTTGGPGY